MTKEDDLIKLRSLSQPTDEDVREMNAKRLVYLRSEITKCLKYLEKIETFSYEDIVKTQEFENLLKFKIFPMTVEIFFLSYSCKIRYFSRLTNNDFFKKQLQELKNILVVVHGYLNEKDDNIINVYHKYFNDHLETKKDIENKVNSIVDNLEINIVKSIISGTGLKLVENWLSWIDQYFYFCDALRVPGFKELFLSEDDMNKFFYTFWRLRDYFEECLLSVPKEEGIEQFIFLNEYKAGSLILCSQNYKNFIYAAKTVSEELQKEIEKESQKPEEQKEIEVLKINSGNMNESVLPSSSNEGMDRQNKGNKIKLQYFKDTGCFKLNGKGFELEPEQVNLLLDCCNNHKKITSNKPIPKIISVNRTKINNKAQKLINKDIVQPRTYMIFKYISVVGVD